MTKLTLTEAFAKYDATLQNHNWSVSAENQAGELVVSLWKQYFAKPDGNIIRYVDRVSRWKGLGNKEFRERIKKAYSFGQVVRVVMATTNDENAVEAGKDARKLKNTFSVRMNWFGKVVFWNGDNFEIHFTQMP